MPTSTPAEGRPASVAASSGITNLQVSVTVFAAVVLALAFVTLLAPPLVVPAVLGLIPPDGVRVSATISGDAVASHQIKDARTVTDLYARINRLPSSIRGLECGPGYPGESTYTYTFDFTRGGMLIETASAYAVGGCVSEWAIDGDGLGNTRVDLTGVATREILAEAQLPPLPQF